MTQVVNTTNFSGDSASITLTNGSQAGRGLILIESQWRVPPDINTTITLDGVAPTNAWLGTRVADLQTLVAYWSDADLPATAGTYTATLTNGPSDGAFIEISGWDGSAPELKAGVLTGGAWTSPYNITFASTTAGAFMAGAAVQLTGSGPVLGTEISGASNYESLGTKTDSAGDGFIVLTADQDSDAGYQVLAFNSASTGSTPTLTTSLVADSNDTALPSAIDWFVRVDDANNALVGTATITTAGPVSISNSDLTLETGMSLADATQYRVDFQEVGGTRQRTVMLTAAV